MNLNNAAFIVDEFWTTCTVTFTNDVREFTYAIPREYKVLLDELGQVPGGVYVVTPGANKNPEMSLAQLIRIHDEPDYDASNVRDLKPIAGVIDTSVVNEGMNRHAQVLTKLQKKQRRGIRDQVLASFGLSSVSDILTIKAPK